ncbi:MAG: TetR/AcrR family transcriptional regulator [Glycomyces artemisiae]|uniref:TetR family transcriptional regulator n=1 Tax=Glycomyces artemisiae TaxID=1076443 RepID=A0A2T0UWE1_9ACTN|nr:TetR/AcrR family transcriptional regulator [Glycomyces artemisiae]NUQ87363.1 TetR/AcrR family transcriptional regulator [Glycomyces artemisiae]PRY62243.1 TetR family transcriptional regulator [Glycomyces artemisiae]
MTESTPGRRRGDDLEHAIFDAALAELAEVGYANVRMEAVAARAKAGKASLYKRWPDRARLIQAAARYKATEVEPSFEPSGDLRGDMRKVMRHIAGQQASPFGEAIRGWIGELKSTPDEVTEDLRTRIETPRIRIFAKIYEDGVARGTVKPEALHPRVVNLAPGLLTHYFLTRAEPATDDVIEEFLDHVLMPLIATGEGAERLEES